MRNGPKKCSLLATLIALTPKHLFGTKPSDTALMINRCKDVQEIDTHSRIDSLDMTSETTFNDIEGDTMNAGDNNSASISSRWHLFRTDCPKSEIVFVCQVFVLYTVILVSIYNLTFGRTDSNSWISFSHVSFHCIGASDLSPYRRSLFHLSL